MQGDHPKPSCKNSMVINFITITELLQTQYLDLRTGYTPRTGQILYSVHPNAKTLNIYFPRAYEITES